MFCSNISNYIQEPGGKDGPGGIKKCQGGREPPLPAPMP